LLYENGLGLWMYPRPKPNFKTEFDYLSSTTASSKDFFKASASSLVTPSLTFDGALSTTSLASLRPKPVSSLPFSQQLI
jgi:hypothetical protein